MNIKCAKDVIAVAKDRGFEIKVNPGPPPMPLLMCPPNLKPLATPALMAALKVWRLEIIEEISREEKGE